MNSKTYKNIHTFMLLLLHIFQIPVKRHSRSTNRYFHNSLFSVCLPYYNYNFTSFSHTYYDVIFYWVINNDDTFFLIVQWALIIRKKNLSI